MGNPFINAVYIGHPGWKSMGGRIGYSAATEIMVLLLCVDGNYLRDVGADPGGGDLPDSALYRDADRRPGFPGNPPRSHAPAIILALVPHLAAWGKF